MTTSRSPLRVLKSQADNIARIVKAVERGENLIEDRGGKIAAARERESVIFGVVMDDKVVRIEMAWSTIRETSEAGIAEFVLRQMRGARDAAN
jgi:hypothetical protein